MLCGLRLILRHKLQIFSVYIAFFLPQGLYFGVVHGYMPRNFSHRAFEHSRRAHCLLPVHSPVCQVAFEPLYFRVVKLRGQRGHDGNIVRLLSSRQQHLPLELLLLGKLLSHKNGGNGLARLFKPHFLKAVVLQGTAEIVEFFFKRVVYKRQLVYFRVDNAYYRVLCLQRRYRAVKRHKAVQLLGLSRNGKLLVRYVAFPRRNFGLKSVRLRADFGNLDLGAHVFHQLPYALLGNIERLHTLSYFGYRLLHVGKIVFEVYLFGFQPVKLHVELAHAFGKLVVAPFQLLRLFLFFNGDFHTGLFGDKGIRLRLLGHKLLRYRSKFAVLPIYFAF